MVSKEYRSKRTKVKSVVDSKDSIVDLALHGSKAFIEISLSPTVFLKKIGQCYYQKNLAGEADRKLTLSASTCHTRGKILLVYGTIFLSLSNLNLKYFQGFSTSNPSGARLCQLRSARPSPQRPLGSVDGGSQRLSRTEE